MKISWLVLHVPPKTSAYWSQGHSLYWECPAKLKVFCLPRPGENCLINYFSFIRSLDPELVWRSKSISHKKCDPGQFSDQIHRWQSSVQTTVQWAVTGWIQLQQDSSQLLLHKEIPGSLSLSGLLKHEFPPPRWNSLCVGTGEPAESIINIDLPRPRFQPNLLNTIISI